MLESTGKATMNKARKSTAQLRIIIRSFAEDRGANIFFAIVTSEPPEYRSKNKKPISNKATTKAINTPPKEMPSEISAIILRRNYKNRQN